MNEQEMRQGMATLEAYKSQSEAMNEQGQLLQMSLEDYSRARDTLDAISKGKEGDEVLMPVGGSSYVYATIARNDSVLVGIGTGISMNKPISEAIATVGARIEELMDALKKVGESRTVIEAKMQQLSQILQQEYQKMQQGLK
ncbi:MAG TPA: prefoldin subunit alpha [Methanomassiliicoccales archaeon]|nr:prefoldin subunit alpha [Methanomassiliicoccales archaeon]